MDFYGNQTGTHHDELKNGGGINPNIPDTL